MAAHRDRYAIVGVSALGSAPQTVAQRRDAVRARAALEAAKRLMVGADAFTRPHRTQDGRRDHHPFASGSRVPSPLK